MRETEAERICTEAERAYFKALGWPRPTITVIKEESEAERLYREAWEREYKPGRVEEGSVNG